ncbi:serine protease [Laspinema sp. A4]|uniref:S1 family peptidase n=1 Tax=Laspinema sp. D2d TaxID=2953686 RepID=UPI0021BB459C|nr:serine protease [Laspinema sp. D2d]MCT7985517.1 serine protease [Laspinema sp. D2d]
MTLPTQLFPLSSSAQILPVSGFTAEPSAQLLTEEVRQIAQSITVKVLSGRSGGSGIVIQKQGSIYTVVTNQHVLTAGKGSGYQIQTTDGRIYAAEVVRTVNFESNDLALLQFRSTGADYTVASLGTSSTLKPGDEVFAAGFPFESEQLGSAWTFTTGTISLIADRAIEGGYQIAYTNPVEKGMSGGPILNRQGQVIGLNGMHAYPLWGDPYLFTDGSRPSTAIREIMVRSSMGIAIDTFVQLAGGFSNPVEMPAARVPIAPTESSAESETQEGSVTTPPPHQASPSALPVVQESPILSNPRSEALW